MILYTTGRSRPSTAIDIQPGLHFSLNSAIQLLEARVSLNPIALVVRILLSARRRCHAKLTMSHLETALIDILNHHDTA